VKQKGRGAGPRLFMPPGPASDDRSLFHRYMAEVLELTGGGLPVGLGQAGRDEPEWENAARAAVAAGLPQAGPWPEAVFETLIRAAVHDPDPSFSHQLIEPALAVAGRRQVQEALLSLLVSGTNAEKAGAARAWYWAQAPLAYRGLENLKTGTPTEESKREYDAVADLRARWREAALREFASNEDLDVRRCILPGLTLKPALYPDDLKDLVVTTVRIARAHPDEYIRHRVEHQV